VDHARFSWTIPSVSFRGNWVRLIKGQALSFRSPVQFMFTMRTNQADIMFLFCAVILMLGTVFDMSNRHQ
jgi:hypothetical protein